MYPDGLSSAEAVRARCLKSQTETGADRHTMKTGEGVTLMLAVCLIQRLVVACPPTTESLKVIQSDQVYIRRRVEATPVLVGNYLQLTSLYQS